MVSPRMQRTWRFQNMETIWNNWHNFELDKPTQLCYWGPIGVLLGSRLRTVAPELCIAIADQRLRFRGWSWLSYLRKSLFAICNWIQTCPYMSWIPEEPEGQDLLPLYELTCQRYWSHSSHKALPLPKPARRITYGLLMDCLGLDRTRFACARRPRPGREILKSFSKHTWRLDSWPAFIVIFSELPKKIWMPFSSGSTSGIRWFASDSRLIHASFRIDGVASNDALRNSPSMIAKGGW